MGSQFSFLGKNSDIFHSQVENVTRLVLYIARDITLRHTNLVEGSPGIMHLPTSFNTYTLGTFMVITRATYVTSVTWSSSENHPYNWNELNWLKLCRLTQSTIDS